MTLQWNDIINGAFELFGGALMWVNVIKLVKDKQVRGVYWHVTAFFATWSLWNLYYYPSLNQWWSFAGGLAIATGNAAWTALAIYYSRSNHGQRVTGDPRS